MRKQSGYRMFFFGICALALFLRLYHVSDRPHDLSIDEVSIGWNAWSILKTGKDEHGVFLPLWFEAYGEYKLPGYIYATAATQLLLGKNALAIRIPSTISGTLTVLIFMLLVNRLIQNRRFTLLSGLLLATAPWHIHFSRAGFEANMALLFITLGTYVWIEAAARKNFHFFWAGCLSFVGALYTYNASRVSVPLLCVALAYLLRHRLKNSFARPRGVWYFVILLILTIPFILFVTSSAGQARIKTESFTRDLPSQVNVGPLQKWNWLFSQLGKNYLSYFSVDFLFFSGDPIGRHSVREMGMLYLWQLPFLLTGLALACKQKKTADVIFTIWLLIIPIPAAFAAPNPHALRALPHIIPLTYFTVRGIMAIPQRLRVPIIITALFVGLGLLEYLNIYFLHYPPLTSPDWSGGYKEAMVYATTHEQKYDQIVFSDTFKKGYAYLYFYGQFNPQQVLTVKNYELENGKFSFRGSPYIMPPKTLYFALPTDPSNGKRCGEIRNRTGDLQYVIWEN